jgi:hypothetical protein
VQAAVEADCVAQKEKQERADALAVAAARAQKEAGIEPPAPVPAAAPARSVRDFTAEERASRQRAEQETQKKACASLNDEMSDLRARERAGGSSAAMERLSGERRRLQERTSRSGC